MSDNISIKKAGNKDKKMIWEWWNDPVTRKMMKKNNLVPWEEHSKWYDQFLKRSCYVYPV